MTRVVAYVPDLMDRSRLGGVAGITFVSSPVELATAEADVLVVDLTRPGVIDAVAGIERRVIGFAGHVEEALLEAAEAAGCEAYRRSVFFGRLDELLRSDEVE